MCRSAESLHAAKSTAGRWCKGVQGPSSGVEFASVCTPVPGVLGCRNENFAAKAQGAAGSSQPLGRPLENPTFSQGFQLPAILLQSPRAAAARAAAVSAAAATAVARAVPVASGHPSTLEALCLEPATEGHGVWAATDGRGLMGLDGCEVRLCDPCARVSRVCTHPAPPVVFLPVPVPVS